jgi:outer membrane protein OmpA-like peptidoglycan-associated protein
MKKRLFAAGVLGLLVLAGCSTPKSHFGIPDKAGKVPQWISDSERMIDKAAASPGAKFCPDKIARAYKYAAHAVETYWQCNDANAKSLLKDAREFAAEAAACTPPPVAAPVPQQRASAGPMTLSAKTLFAFDRADLSPKGKDRLDRFLKDLAKVSWEGIMIVGHTDPMGTEKYNQGLSERRAQTVANYLAGRGVPWSRMSTEGRGERELVITYKECAS